jgi:hypothetical protein
LAKEVSAYGHTIMSYSPSYQSDYAPVLPNEDLSSAHALRQSKIDSMSFE